MSKKMRTATMMPKLRFPEFLGEWENDVLDTLFTNRQETGVNLPLMSLTDEFGIIPQTDSNKRDNSNVDKSKYLRICNGDIVYNTMRMWQGRCAFSTVDGIVSPAYTVCTPKGSNIGLFFYYYFKTANMIRKFRANSQGLVNDTLNLKYDAFSKIAIDYPWSSEQQKIADCLTSLDELIAAENNKLESLKTHKKGLMQKLFPAEGKTMPEWRFPEFRECGEWEENRLSQITTYVDYRGKTPVKSSSGIFLLTAKNIKMGYIDYLCSQEFIPENDYNEVMSRGKPEIGDVLITTEAPCGNVAQIDKVNIALAQRVIKYRGIDGKLNNTFLKYVFLSPKFQDNLFSKSTGGIVKGIKGSVLHELPIDFPKLNEQQRIADSLSALDELITAQTEKIETLKAHKAGLMQGLFPSAQEVIE